MTARTLRTHVIHILPVDSSVAMELLASRRGSPRRIDVILKGNFGWARPMLVGPWDRVVIRDEVNRCRNEEVIVKGNFGWVWLMWAGPRVEIDRIVIRDVQYQFEVNRCRNEEVNFQGSSANSTDGQTAEINTISPRFYIILSLTSFMFLYR
ncbi:hypothetical protein DPMN_029453 [Dreissena polymorpha]|uniref:Uncharacterized protein n=1 Tax=Dreissena polymorpha TaxID=45954 RepID=A0A9D4LWH1_DREPO|nr:hypothetical protein DPMN_029453 [Dreissena polymorpha]